MPPDVNWLSLLLHVASGAVVGFIFARYASFGLFWMVVLLASTPYILLIVVNILWSNGQGWLGCIVYLVSFMLVLRAQSYE